MTSSSTFDLCHITRAVHDRYGYDFRGYSQVSLERRFRLLLAKTGLSTLGRLESELLRSEDFFAGVLSDLTVTTSEMFRDPAFYAAFRAEIVPVLRTYPVFKIWLAGCGRGEESYSLAILLEEAGLYDRAVIYATDINPAALRTAKTGIYTAADVRTFTTNYLASGGQESVSTYYTASHGGVQFDPRLRRNILYAVHNLACDDVFSEVQVVLCRNVLIYFDRDLQSRCLDLFNRSLCFKGYLCLGARETVRFLPGRDAYADVACGQKVFRKISRGPDEPFRPAGNGPNA